VRSWLAAGPSDSREPRLLLDQPRRWRRGRNSAAVTSENLPDSFSGVDGFDLGSARAFQFLARSAPRLHPSPEDRIIRAGLLWHRAFIITRPSSKVAAALAGSRAPPGRLTGAAAWTT